jgi:arginase
VESRRPDSNRGPLHYELRRSFHNNVMQRRAWQELRLIASPYHDGLESVDRGRGPTRLLDAARASGALAAVERPVSVEIIGPVDPASPEVARVFALNRRLGERVQSAVADGAFPLVLAGDCNSCLGTVAGCGTDALGVVWFDAHADFDTPDDSLSGSLDGMGLAMLTGRGWQTLRDTVLDLAPIDEDHVVLAAVRDLEPAQRHRLRASRIRSLEGNNFSEAEFRAALDDLHDRAGRVYLHIDLDSLDPSEGTANQYSAPGGLSCAQLLARVADVFGRFDVVAASITAYNPDSDVDGRMATTATRVLAAVAERALQD